MTTWRQFQALNALKSTGPRTEEGKRMSRCHALRHGLTAETVIDGLEDSEDYRGFEAAIIADYDAETAVERELVLRPCFAAVAAASHHRHRHARPSQESGDSGRTYKSNPKCRNTRRR
jgi:hypothetical protein